MKEALGGNSKTTLLIACSPHSSNVDETVSTLRFGQRAKTIKNKVSARIHRSVEELNSIILQLQKEIAYLRRHTKLLESQLSSRDSTIDLKAIQSQAKGSHSQDSTTGSNFTQVEDDDGDDNEVESDYNPMTEAELQVAMEKLREESSFSISKLQEQITAASEVLDEKENQINDIRMELASSKQSLAEQLSNQSTTQQQFSIQKQVCYSMI